MKVHIMSSLRCRLKMVANTNSVCSRVLAKARKERRALILEAYLEGMKVKEIAKLVGWSTEKVRQVIAEGRSK